MMQLAVTLPNEYEQELFHQLVLLNQRAIEQVKHDMYDLKDRYINHTTLLKALNIGDKQVQEWKRQGLKSVKIGRKTCYDIKDIHAIIEKNKM